MNKGRQLEVEANKLRKELERFLRLIADGKARTVMAEIKRREQRLTELERERQVLNSARKC